jgi:hypothetical protein
MIDIKELMVGDWVDRSGTPPYYKVIGINSKTTEVLISQSGNDDETRRICWNDKLDPIPLTPEILEKNGWFYKNGYWTKKGPVRLSWHEKDATLIAGYWTVPCAIEFVHQLQLVLRLLGLEDIEL